MSEQQNQAQEQAQVTDFESLFKKWSNVSADTQKKFEAAQNFAEQFGQAKVEHELALTQSVLGVINGFLNDAAQIPEVTEQLIAAGIIQTAAPDGQAPLEDPNVGEEVDPEVDPAE